MSGRTGLGIEADAVVDHGEFSGLSVDAAPHGDLGRARVLDRVSEGLCEDRGHVAGHRGARRVHLMDVDNDGRPVGSDLGRQSVGRLGDGLGLGGPQIGNCRANTFDQRRDQFAHRIELECLARLHFELVAKCVDRETDRSK